MYSSKAKKVTVNFCLVKNEINEEKEEEKFIKEKKSELYLTYIDYPKMQQVRKLSDNNCFIKQILEKHGSLYVYERNITSLMIARIKTVVFPMKKYTFEKGKSEIDSFYNLRSDSIPDIKFWFQRFYYYSRFSEGIKMDHESNIFQLPRLVFGYSGRNCKIYRKSSYKTEFYGNRSFCGEWRKCNPGIFDLINIFIIYYSC